jgi:acyl carrier protein
MDTASDATFQKIRDCLVTVLGVDEVEVKAEASLIEDLGAESSDFVDLIFRLEKAFGIHIPQGELFPQDFFSNKEYVASGKFTIRGLEVFKARYPFIELNGTGDFPVSQLSKLYTVNMLVNYVKFKTTVA